MMTKRLFALLSCSLCLLAATAQQLKGDWQGKVNIGPATLRIGLHVEHANDSYSGTMDSPDQGAYALPMADIAESDGRVTFAVPQSGIRYAGTLRGDSLLDGTLTQGNASIPLRLQKGESLVKRPQTPRPPFPYRSEEVTIRNEKAGVTLAGTLTLPDTTGKCKAVIIVSGSGAQDRNNTFFEHKTYLVLADYLSRQGIAVLRMDDRGVGQSEGNAATTSLPDETADARAAIAYLKTRPEIHPDSIGIIGHSEGAFVAFTLAAAGESPFIITLAGGGVCGSELLLMQRAALLRANGAQDAFITFYNNYMRQAQNVVLQSKDQAACRQELAKLFAGSPLAGQEANLTSQLFNPATIELMRYNPLPDFQRITCPVLALNGTKDCQVPVENLEYIQKGIRANGNSKVTVISYPGLNHMFQPAQSGLPSEYSDIEETIDPQVLKDIVQWLQHL